MAVERIRGRALQRIRQRIWLNDPRCARCRVLTMYPSGFELDHILALTNGGTNDDSNMQILCCDGCHEAKTNEDLGYKPKIETGEDGWPVEQSRTTSTASRWRRAARGGK
jgi:5-methylcytosine-specific restriction protein A